MKAVGGQPTALFWSETTSTGCADAGAGPPGRRPFGRSTQDPAARHIDDTLGTGEEAAQMVQDLFAVLQPAVVAAGLELVDVEMKSGVLQVTVDREGGVDLEALTDAQPGGLRACSTRSTPFRGATPSRSDPRIERLAHHRCTSPTPVGRPPSRSETRPHRSPATAGLRGTLSLRRTSGFALAVEGPTRSRCACLRRCRPGPHGVRVGRGQTRRATPARSGKSSRRRRSRREATGTDRSAQPTTQEGSRSQPMSKKTKLIEFPGRTGEIARTRGSRRDLARPPLARRLSGGGLQAPS